MSKEEFLRQKSDAEQRIRDLYRGRSMPPYPDFITLGDKKEAAVADNSENHTEAKKKECDRKNSITPSHTGGVRPLNIMRSLNLQEILKSSDALLILGLILLLLSDNADEKLILALVFILL